MLADNGTCFPTRVLNAGNSDVKTLKRIITLCLSQLKKLLIQIQVVLILCPVEKQNWNTLTENLKKVIKGRDDLSSQLMK